MKALTTTVFFLCLFLLTTVVAAQTKREQTQEIQIKTSAVCNTCRKNIEKALAYERGVKAYNLELPSQILTVSYNPNKTNPDKIRKALSMAGYDADDVPANERAYRKLAPCCKKENPIHGD